MIERDDEATYHGAQPAPPVKAAITLKLELPELVTRGEIVLQVDRSFRGVGLLVHSASSDVVLDELVIGQYAQWRPPMPAAQWVVPGTDGALESLCDHCWSRRGDYLTRTFGPGVEAERPEVAQLFETASVRSRLELDVAVVGHALRLRMSRPPGPARTFYAALIGWAMMAVACSGGVLGAQDAPGAEDGPSGGRYTQHGRAKR